MESSARYLAIVLTALALLRLFSFVTHDPILGYANQYDMARISACLDLWPADVANPTHATVPAPNRWYERKQIAGAKCYPSSEVILGGALVFLAGGEPGKLIDLRIVGLSKAIFLAAFILLFAWVLRQDGQALVAHGAIALFVLTDPVNLLYANTLYSEFSALTGCYLALASLGIVASRREMSWVLACTFSLGLVLLLTSKMQHVVLPWIILSVGCIALCQAAHARRIILPIIILSVATIAQVSAARNVDRGIHNANTYNTAFLTILPSARDAEQVLEDWRLGPDCIRLVGTSWFQRRGYDIERTCPGALSLARVDMIKTLVLNPGVSVSILVRSLFQSGGWIMGFVGHIENEHFGHLAQKKGVQYISFGRIPSAAPFVIYLGVLLLPFAYVVFGNILRDRSKTESPGAGACLVLLTVSCSCIAAIWGVALLGDGFSDLSKHLHLAVNLVVANWIFLICHVSATAHANARLNVSPLVTLGASAIAAAMLISVVVQQPVAIGTLDASSSLVQAGEKLKLAGWVKDPSGVEGVSARVGHRLHPGNLGEEAADVDRMFPLSRNHPGMRFWVEIDVPQSPGWFLVRIESHSHSGIATKIDSIWLEAH